MANITDINNLRRITDGATGYTDQELASMFDQGMTERSIAHRIWHEIAASAATLVDTSESGSSRSLSQAHKNALTMAASFAPIVDVEFDGSAPKRTRKMVRG